MGIFTGSPSVQSTTYSRPEAHRLAVAITNLERKALDHLAVVREVPAGASGEQARRRREAMAHAVAYSHAAEELRKAVKG